jgi:hypothetical protein
MTLYEFVLVLLLTAIDAGGPHPIEDARRAFAYLLTLGDSR